jgi:hypothetical protein
LKSFLSAAVVAAAVGFLAWYGWRHAADLPQLAWRTPGLWVNLLVAVALYDVAAIVSAANWRGLLSAFGGRSRPLVAESVYLMTQIGKYLPGNVGHFVGRVAVGRMRGISAGSCAASMLCEQLLAVSSAALVAAVGYLLWPADFEPLERYLPAARPSSYPKILKEPCFARLSASRPAGRPRTGATPGPTARPIPRTGARGPASIIGAGGAFDQAPGGPQWEYLSTVGRPYRAVQGAFRGDPCRAQAAPGNIEARRIDYNTDRPHPSLGGLTEAEFASRPKEGHNQNRFCL